MKKNNKNGKNPKNNFDPDMSKHVYLQVGLKNSTELSLRGEGK